MTRPRARSTWDEDGPAAGTTSSPPAVFSSTQFGAGQGGANLDVITFLRDHRLALTLAAGAAFRLHAYGSGRPLWLDEGSLLGDIRARTAADVFAVYTNTQLAPPAFMLAEWAVVHTLGASAAAVRLVPLACGLAALAGFAALAGRTLSARAAFAALAMFAVSGDLIYYSAEMKPYMTDVLAAVSLTLAGVAVASGPLTPGRAAAFAAVGGAAVWASFPAALVLAGVGGSLIAWDVVGGRWRRAAALALVAAAWASSFTAAYLVSRRMLGAEGSRGMLAFWDFAFPPRFGGSTLWQSAAWPVRRVLFLFVNPLDYGWPFGPTWSPWLAVGLAAIGFVSLARRDGRLLGMLAGPLAFALAAAYLRLYPFHGRLVLFLAPSLLLLIGEGTGRVADRLPGRWSRAALLASLLVFPTLGALYPVVEPNSPIEHNRFGDIRGPGVEPARGPF